MRKTIRILALVLILTAISAMLATAEAPDAADAPYLIGYEVITQSTPQTSADIIGAHAVCPQGKFVIGGGARLTGTTNGRTLIESFPSGDAQWQPTAWTATARELVSSSSSWGLRVDVICASAVSDYLVLSSSGPVNSISAKSQTVTCPPNTSIISGGARIVQSSYRVTLNGIDHDAPDLWRAIAHEVMPNSNNWGLKVYVICANVPDYQIAAIDSSRSNSPFKSVSPTCPAGKLVTGGGAVIHDTYLGTSLTASGPNGVYTAPNGWIATGIAHGIPSYDSWAIMGEVYCAREGPDPPDPPTINPIENSDENGSFTVSWSSAAGATSYNLQERKNSGSWTTIYNGPNTSKSRSSLADGQWCYRVSASNVGGDSDWSGIECAAVDTTPDSPDSPTIDPIANGDQDGSFTVSWSSAAGATSYQLQERKDGGSWATIYNGSNTGKSRSGLADGEWCYQVKASNASGSSDWSISRCTTVDTTADPLDPPTIEPINNADRDGNFTVSWSDAAGAVLYELQEQFSGGAWITIYHGPDTNKGRSGLADGHWCYRAKASSASGDTDWCQVKCSEVNTADVGAYRSYIPALVKSQ